MTAQAAREALKAEVREAVTAHCTAGGPCVFCEAEIGRAMKAADAYAAQQQPAPRPLAGLMPAGLYFDGGSPVASCLVGDCRWLGSADSVADAAMLWTDHLAEDHRRDWPEARRG